MRKPTVVMYTTTICPYCHRAKRLLDSKGIRYEEIFIGNNTARMREMIERSNRRSVPQIFIGDHHVGGYDDMAALDDKGELDHLLGIK